MKKLAIYLILMLVVSFKLQGQKYEEMNTEQLMEIIGRKNDTTYVVNFWATWCSPCVKEIGYFEELHRNRKDENLKVILISLDFPNRADKQLLPFMTERSITASVLLMTNLDYNSWIDLVDPTWSGAIPATLIFNADRRVFLEQELTREELLKHVKQITK